MNNVTMLEDLPDVGGGGMDMGNILPPDHMNKYNSHIRNSHMAPHQQAGMSSYGGGGFVQENYHQPQQFHMPPNTPTCIEIAEHVQACPICSKFYKNDNSVYIVAIIVLAIICILLMKKVLDV